SLFGKMTYVSPSLVLCSPCCKIIYPVIILSCRLFEYRGRVSPIPRVVPVKRPRVTIPLVRRVKATLPVKLFARSAAIANSSAKLKLKCSELQTIKTELTQIKSNIDALLGRLEQIAEQQKTSTDHQLSTRQ
uniref:Uncharacterized protein n=1 Tax=Varanus komodoensis TaxID=61221 RepID=A0A8D2LRL4_VARKO